MSVNVDADNGEVRATRTVRQSGNSTVVVIPPEMLGAVGFELGFQTNPRGVEAVPVRRPPVAVNKFQTNPRGVEATKISYQSAAKKCFRRTLVGLKPLNGRLEDFEGRVSDEPSWG